MKLIKENLDRQKTRIRNDLEINNQFIGLNELIYVLDFNFIDYWIGGGTLLGFVRESTFIKWDWDVEINLLYKQPKVRYKTIVKELDASGFNCFINRNHRYLKINAYKYDIKYELLFWRGVGSYKTRLIYRLPRKFFKTGFYILIDGIKYNAFYPPEEYLEFIYGEWRVPLRTSNPSEYLSKEIYRPIISRLAKVYRKIKVFL